MVSDMSRTSKLLIAVIVLFLAMVGLATAAFTITSAPSTTVEKAEMSPDNQWKAEVEQETYTMFSPIFYNVLLSEQSGWLARFQRKKIFTITADGQQPVDIQWTGPKELTIKVHPD